MNQKIHAVSFVMILLATVSVVFADDPWFTDVSEELGVLECPSFYVSIADINGDLYPDLFLHDRPG